MENKIISLLKDVLNNVYKWDIVQMLYSGEGINTDSISKYSEFFTEVKDNLKFKELEDSVREFFKQESIKNTDFKKLYEKNSKKLESIFIYNISLNDEMSDLLCTRKSAQSLISIQNYGLVVDEHTLNANIVISKFTNESYSIHLDIFAHSFIDIKNLVDSDVNRYFKQFVEFVNNI